MRCSFEPDSPESPPAAFVPVGGAPTELASDAAERDEARVPVSQIEDLVREAHARGLEEGRASAVIPGADEIAAVTRALSSALRSLEEVRRETLREQHGAIVELALAMADRISHQRLANETEGLAERVRAAVERIEGREGREPVEIALCSSDLESFEAASRDDRELLGREEALWIADPDLGPGEVRVRAGGTRVDGSVAAALEQFREDLLGIESDAEANQ